MDLDAVLGWLKENVDTQDLLHIPGVWELAVEYYNNELVDAFPEPLEEPPNDPTEEWIDMAINHEVTYLVCLSEAGTTHPDFKELDSDLKLSEQWGIKDTYNIDWDYVKRYFEQDE